MGTKGHTSSRQRETVARRRTEITAAALRLVAQHGLQGATMQRIADIVGLSTAALYRYFDSRDEILMAAYDRLADSVHEWIDALNGCQDLASWRELLSRHSDLFSSDTQGFNAPMFQYRVYLPDDLIRKHVAERTARMFSAYEDMIVRCRERGILRADLVPESAVAELLAWMYWENLTYLSSPSRTGLRERSGEMLSRVVDSIAARD